MKEDVMTNINGLIRQYLPKKTDFTKIENGYIEYIENELNNRPRKKLGYKTPNEVFYKNINKNFANSKFIIFVINVAFYT